jgi:cytochrome c
MRARQILTPHVINVAIAFSALTIAIPCQAEPNVLAGKAFAQANCSHCDSIDKVTQSTLAIAPPFRNLHERYPVESLEEALAEGIMTGHPSMPEFRLDPGQIGDLIAFLKSLELHHSHHEAQGVTMAQRIIDLSLTIEDNMPAHKLFQRPVFALHMSHESTKAHNLGVPGDAMTFQPTWTQLAMGEYIVVTFRLRPIGLRACADLWKWIARHPAGICRNSIVARPANSC